MRHCLSLLLLLIPTTGYPLDYQTVWSRAQLYDDQDAAILQGIRLSGRAQGDWSYVNADQGDFDDVRWRRFRFGGEATFKGDIRTHLEAEFDFNEDISSSYSRLTEAWIGWSPAPGWQALLLKHSAGFTLDGATSSKRLVTTERNNLTHNLWFTSEYFTGALIQGPCAGMMRCRFGVFSNDDADEISDFDASWFALASVTWNFGPTGQQVRKNDKASLRVDYVRNDEDKKADTRPFTDVISVVWQWQHDRWHTDIDLSAGLGFEGQSDLVGLVIMPYYDIAPRWQAVTRLTWIEGGDSGGIRLNRYENEVAGERGDHYGELFAGLNWFVYGHRLKWQAGLQYAWLDDGNKERYQGWAANLGLRVYW